MECHLIHNLRNKLQISTGWSPNMMWVVTFKLMRIITRNVFAFSMHKPHRNIHSNYCLSSSLTVCSAENILGTLSNEHAIFYYRLFKLMLIHLSFELRKRDLYAPLLRGQQSLKFWRPIEQPLLSRRQVEF